MSKAKANVGEVEKRSEIAVAVYASCGGHAVKDLDELARLVVANPRSPKLPKGIDWIGAGISKSTIGICPQHVLKVCYGDGGWVGPQGLQEIEFWRKAPEDVRQLLAPIEACDAQGRWILAGRCIPMGRYDGRLPAGLQDAAIRAMGRAGLGDLHANNIGVYVKNGEPHVVCLDYGVAQGIRGKLGDRQPIMGVAAGTAIAVAKLDPLHCFTGKLTAYAVGRGHAGKACDCGRCDGRGLGFHKGMGLKQRKAPLGLTKLCWTGNPAPCGCPRCDGNHKLGRKRDVAIEPAAMGHAREMAARPDPATKAPRMAAKARKAAIQLPADPAGLRALKAAIAAAPLPSAAKASARRRLAQHERMLAAQVNPLGARDPDGNLAIEHDRVTGIDGDRRCACDICQNAACPACGAVLFGLLPKDCFCQAKGGHALPDAGREDRRCPGVGCSWEIACQCDTACVRHCCENRAD